MTRRNRLKRSVTMLVWRTINPPTSVLAGVAPWWVLLETVGRRTGKQRRTTGTASVVPYDAEIVGRFSRYARSGPVAVGIDPALIRVELSRAGGEARSPGSGRA